MTSTVQASTSTLSEHLLARAETMLRDATLHRDVTAPAAGATTSAAQHSTLRQTVDELHRERTAMTSSKSKRSRSTKTQTSSKDDEMETFLADLKRNKEPSDSDFDTDLEEEDAGFLYFILTFICHRLSIGL